MANLLIVDDDRDVAEGLGELLQGAGHFVRTAGTGEEGLRALRAAQLPDCILLDLDMPVLDGRGMAHRMLLHDAGEELVPVVLVSGRSDLPTIAAQLGTPYYLAKPADSQVLLALIDRALRERVAPSFAGMKEEDAGETTSRAQASPEREVTDESLRGEREKSDAARREQRTAIEGEADEVVKRARSRADAVLQSAREGGDQAAAQSPVTEEVRAEVRREERAADVVTSAERVTADEALRHERGEKQRVLDDFLDAERTLTDASLEDERVHSDITVTSRDEFLGMVSHDLRGLLNAIGLNVSSIARSADPGEAGAATRKKTTNIERAMGRMNRLIGDLLDIASIEAGSLRIEPAPTDAHEVVTETVEAFAEIARSKGITIECDESAAAAEPLAARLDHGRILQVLANLLSNAIKFTQAGGRIVVRVARVGDDVQFAVEDNGPGVPADLLDAIFERYRQIRADRRGLGLGLYISKGIVEAHGGTIWAESRLGEGSTFYFTIPRARVESRGSTSAPSALA